MGVAKAALESAVRYLAAELVARAFGWTPSPLGHWRRELHPHPGVRRNLDKAKVKAPARSLVSINDVGMATALLTTRRASHYR